MTGTTHQITRSLFQTIEYADQKSLGVFLNNLKSDQAFLIVSEALNYAHRNGIFDLNESEAISRSMRILNTNE